MNVYDPDAHDDEPTDESPFEDDGDGEPISPAEARAEMCDRARDDRELARIAVDFLRTATYAARDADGEHDPDVIAADDLTRVAALTRLRSIFLGLPIARRGDDAPHPECRR